MIFVFSRLSVLNLLSGFVVSDLPCVLVQSLYVCIWAFGVFLFLLFFSSFVLRSFGFMCYVGFSEFLLIVL